MEHDDDEHLMESYHAGNAFRYMGESVGHFNGDLDDQRY